MSLQAWQAWSMSTGYFIDTRKWKMPLSQYMFFWNAQCELSHEQPSKNKLSQVWDRGSLMSPRAGILPRGRLQKQTWSESEVLHLKICTYYCVYVGEDAMVGRWRSEGTSPQVFLFPLEYGIWHQTCCQTCWAILSAPTVCIAISFQITWMLTDRWPMDHRFSSSDTGSLLSNEIFSWWWKCSTFVVTGHSKCR